MTQCAIASILFALWTQAPLHPTSTDPVTIGGHVVDDSTGDALVNVRIALVPSIAGSSVVLTNADGAFSVTAPAGSYSVSAGKSGFAPITVPIGTKRSVEIRLRRGAAITGRVVDDFGDPVDARVEAGKVSSASGKVVTIAGVDTNDRGEYRLAGLPAEAVVVAVMYDTGALETQIINNDQVVFGPRILTAYYPGVTNSTQAQALELGAGEEHSGIDFVVPVYRPSVPPAVSERAKSDPIPLSTPSGVIRGRVTSTDGRVLAHANVRLIPWAALSGRQAGLAARREGLADEDGHFEFRDLPAGTFDLEAEKYGYSSIRGGGSSTVGIGTVFSSQSVELATGEIRENIELTLTRWTALEGRIFDELGNPVQAATVRALVVGYSAGRRRQLIPAGMARQTDDLGRYRLYNLPPNQYIVSADVGAVRSADLPGYARSYYPGTPLPSEAQFVTLEPSRDVAGVDFSLSRTKTARVTGVLLNAAGEPTMGGSVRLVPAASSAVTNVPEGARISRDGVFEFPNVPPGQYVIRAERNRANHWTEGEFGSLPVSVNGEDVRNLVLQTSAGSSIGGRVTFEGARDSSEIPPSGTELAPVPVDVDSAPTQIATANIHPDWSFEILGVNGPRRLVLRHAPAGWALGEILVNGIDVTDRPLAFGKKEQSLTDVEVVLTDRINQIVGTVADEKARPAVGSHVVVFSTDRDRWYPASRYQETRAVESGGSFAIGGLPSGGFYVAAVSRLPANGDEAWSDPQFLASLIPQASTVTVGTGERVSVNLKLPSR